VIYLPPIGNVITIPSKSSILIVCQELNLAGNRLYFEEDCCLFGTSSETVLLTGSLTGTESLITSVGSLVLSNISISVSKGGVLDDPSIFNLDGVLEPVAALDWLGVNCVGGKIGTIKNYGNVVLMACAIIGDSQGFIFDGSFDSIVFDGSIFRNAVSGTCIINRRIRIENTPISVPAGGEGINLSVLASVPVEGYILKYVSFSGLGSKIVGVQHSDNKSVFIGCKGIENSTSVAEYYMINNTTATTIASTSTFYKVLGTTLSGLYNQRFTNTNNRTTYNGAITSYFKISVAASCNSGNTHLIVFRIAKNGVTIPSSEVQVTTNSTGRSENIHCQTIVQLQTNDYLEVFVQNSTTTTNVTVSELNLIAIPLIN